jgi:hypothetical protein
MIFDREPMFQMDYEDNGGFGGNSPSLAPNIGGLDALKPIAPVQDALTYLNSNPNGTPSPEQQKVIDDYFAANPIVFDAEAFTNAWNSADPDKPVNDLTKQILGQNLTDKWSGAGFGSAEANARDMAKILAGIGITDINQFGKVTVEEDVPYFDEYGTGSTKQKRETFGNKLTGKAVPNTYSERQTGDFWGGTFAGKGNTGYGVQFDEQGNPFFYTQGASSSDIGKLAPILAIAQFIPALAPFATAANAAIAASQGNVLGAIAGAAGLGGYSDIANAANFAGAVKSGNPLSIISSGANLGGTDLGGAANAAGLGDLNNIGGFNVNDIAKTYRTVKALESGDPASIISALGGYVAGSNNQAPTSPLDQYVPIDSGSSSGGTYNAPPKPADDFSDYYSGGEFGFEQPVSRSIAERPIESSIGATPPEEMPRISFNPTDLYQEPIRAPEQTPDMTGKSFNSAFAQARASGAKEFLWNDNVYNTNLAPATDKMNAGPKSNRTINTGAGMDPSALAGWGGSKVDPNFIKAAAPYMGWDPSTYFPNINIRMADPTAAYGNVPEYVYKPNEQSYLNIAPYLTRIGEKANEPGMAADVLSHELAHVGQKLASAPGQDPTKLHMRMAQQAGLNVLSSVNRPDDVTKFNEDLDRALPYINQKYGQMSTGYINNATGKTTTNKYDPSSKLFEKLTDLASLEMQTGKDLTSDPYLKETLFKDPKVVAMYNAMTIPRMTRLDPRDLPPGQVTSSDFPKGQVPLGFRFRSALRGGKAEGGLASLNRSSEQ